jgi:hypothetical protein
MAKKAKQTGEVVEQVKRIAHEIGFTGKGYPKFARELNTKGVKTPTGEEWDGKYLPVFCKREGIVFAPKPDVAEPPKPAQEATEPEQHTTPTEATPQAIIQDATAAPPEIPQDKQQRADTTQITHEAIKAEQKPIEPAETPLLEPRHEDTTVAPPMPKVLHHTDTTSAPRELPDVMPQPEVHPISVTPLPLDADTVEALREVATWWLERKAKGEGMESEKVTTTVAPQAPQYRPVFPGARVNSGVRLNERLMKAALEKAKTPEEAARTSEGKLSPLIELLLWQYLGFDEQYLNPETMPDVVDAKTEPHDEQ